ncbi:MAG: MFS transporter [Candidatus Eisenbacteria bacterium]|nr:MFS transporter [Candidatus Eisenbacteria bacterium]
MTVPAAGRPTRDRTILYGAAFLRALATGMTGVLLGIYVAGLGGSPSQIGAVIAAGLAGGAVATLAATVAGDRFGRRRFLLASSLLSAAGAVALAVSSRPVTLALAAFLGMVNGMGRDRGAALVVEQAALPSTTSDRDRTRAIAWYNVLQDAGHAAGSLLAGLPGLLQHAGGLASLPALRLSLGVPALLALAGFALYLGLTRAVEPPAPGEPLRVTPATRGVLWRIGSLFALDALGGGFLTTALLSLYFFQRFGAGAGVIGVLFFGARVANALSHLLAARLARRIGLVNTMVFTHIPSSLLLVTVPFAPSFAVAALLFLLREGLVEMDVPTRQSYVLAVVRPEERTFATGVTHLVRLGAWAVAPAFAGFFMQRWSLAMPLFVGAGMKIAYDVMLFAAFRRLKPPEERG